MDKSKNGIRAAVPGVLLALLFFFAVPVVFAQGSAEKGKQIFQTKCTTCHTIGQGKKVGPDLKGVAKERPKNWLISFISDPDQMFAKNDPTATKLLKEYQIKMPPPGLSPQEVKEVVAYLETQK